MFSLIGPKRYDAPWKDIEAQGWIAPAECTEVRVTLTGAERMTYATAEAEERYRMAATARTKLPVVRALRQRPVRGADRKVRRTSGPYIAGNRAAVGRPSSGQLAVGQVDQRRGDSATKTPRPGRPTSTPCSRSRATAR